MADIIIHPATGTAGRLILAKETPLALCPSTLPVTPDGMKARLNAMGTSDLSMDADRQIVMQLAHVMVYWRHDTDEETGKPKEYSWIVLIDPEGHTFGTASEVVAHKIMHIIDLWACNMLERPCTIVIREQKNKTNKGYHYDLKVL